MWTSLLLLILSKWIFQTILWNLLNQPLSWIHIAGFSQLNIQSSFYLLLFWFFNLNHCHFLLQVLPLDMSLATVKAYIWKKPEDLILNYRVVQAWLWNLHLLQFYLILLELLRPSKVIFHLPRDAYIYMCVWPSNNALSIHFHFLLIITLVNYFIFCRSIPIILLQFWKIAFSFLVFDGTSKFKERTAKKKKRC